MLDYLYDVLMGIEDSYSKNKNYRKELARISKVLMAMKTIKIKNASDKIISLDQEATGWSLELRSSNLNERVIYHRLCKVIKFMSKQSYLSNDTFTILGYEFPYNVTMELRERTLTHDTYDVRLEITYSQFEKACYDLYADSGTQDTYSNFVESCLSQFKKVHNLDKLPRCLRQ